MQFTNLAVLAVMASCVKAAPASQLAPGLQSFTIHQKSTGRHHHKSGHRAITNAYRKFGKSVPVLTKRWGGAYTNDSADPTAYDVEYLSPISVGTPAKELMMVGAICKLYPPFQLVLHTPSHIVSFPLLTSC